MSKRRIGLLLVLMMLAAARLPAGPVEYSARLLPMSGWGEASGQGIQAPGLDFDRNGFLNRGSMDPGTGLFLTPMFFQLPVWGNGFRVLDFGDLGWGWGWGYNELGYLPLVTCFGGFCREAEPPSGGIAAGALPYVNSTTSATLDTGLTGPLASADQPVGNPEPGTLVLFATGLAAAFFHRRKS